MEKHLRGLRKGGQWWNKEHEPRPVLVELGDNAVIREVGRRLRDGSGLAGNLDYPGLR